MLRNLFIKLIATFVFLSISALILWFVWLLLGQAVNVTFKTGFWAPVGPYELNDAYGVIPTDGNPPKITGKDLGEISPLSGKLTIAKKYSYLESSSPDPSKEMIYIIANIRNKEPVNISGMILQSLITGNVAIIPKGVKLYKLGQVNAVEDIMLKPGQAALVYTGASPLSVSFLENKCMGYLNNLNSFNPPLSKLWCPSPQSLVPNTVDNIKKYGDVCMDAVRDLQKCEYFTSENKYYNQVSPQCRSKLTNELTYEACVITSVNDKDFFPVNASWRAYLELPQRLWKDKYEVIKLMDKDGKTVFVTSY